jgi:glycosyltransferase involved in cell wall biosynthesis
MPLISVLLPVYNAGRYLDRALRSLFDQTEPDFEIVAVDDGSRDDSGKILERHAGRDARLRVIRRPNTGIVGALNDAIAAAGGEFLARMDADDLAAPTRFAEQVARFRAEPGLVALGSDVMFIDAAGHPVKACPRARQHPAIEQALLQGDGGAMIHPSVMFRATAVRAAGGYRLLRRDAQYYEDLDLYLRLARLGTLANLAGALLHYRVHAGSINFTRHTARRDVKLAVLREAYAVRGLPFDSTGFSEVSSHTADPALHHREWAVTSLAHGPRRVAVGHGWRAVWLRPREAASWRALRFALSAPVPPPGPFR